MSLAIIGDFNPASKTHLATNEAIIHSTKYLGADLQADWVATDTILNNFTAITENYNGFWIAPGSPYQSMDGVLKIINYARLNQIPTLGTCGGFQHMVIEFARNVLEITDAAHAEYNPYSSKLVINPLSCSLFGQTLQINLTNQQSLAYKLYNTDKITANYYCNFGLNPAYQADLNDNGFKITGIDDSEEARILELENHPFFIATLFVPQDGSTLEEPNKLVTAFISTLVKI